MYIRRNIRWQVILRFAWPRLLFFIFWNGLITQLFHHLEHHEINISLPFLPLSTIGIAVAFYIGFKNNAAYDRFWEARKIWGGIVNYSRTWGNQVISFITPFRSFEPITDAVVAEYHQELIYRHIAWLNALRHHLRKPSSFSLKRTRSDRRFSKDVLAKEQWDEEVGGFLDDTEYMRLINKVNVPAQIIRNQGEKLKEFMHQIGLIDDFRHMEMMRVLEEFYNLQGKCERIKNTPFPRQYAYFSRIFTWIFILLLPFGMVGQFSEMGHEFIWLTVPVSVLISWIFITMELVGDNSEDPFENFINDVPMTALCRTIEIDLREMLGETDLPPKIKPIHDILF